MIKEMEERIENSTWNKTDPKEPVFILRAKDKFAPRIIQIWAGLCSLEGAPQEKLDQAERLAVTMINWQKEHGSKLPD